MTERMGWQDQRWQRQQEQAEERRVNGHDPSHDWDFTAHRKPDPYPLHALPPVLRNAIAEYHRFGKQPVPLIATSAISASAVAAQGLVDVERDRALFGPVSINMMTVAESGERKTSADNLLARPLIEAQAELLEEMSPQIEAAQRRLEAWTAERDGHKTRIKEMTKRNKMGEAEEAKKALEAMGSAPRIPPFPHFTFEDITTEALARDMANGWPSAGLWSAEGATILGSWGATDEKSSSRFFALLNKLWGGEDYRSSRISRGKILLEGRRITTSILVQSQEFAKFVSANDGAARGIGLLSRYLICEPDSTMGGRFYEPPPETSPAFEAYRAVIRNLMKRPLPLDERGRLEPHRLKLDAEAKAMWVTYHDNVEAELLKDLEDVKDLAAKIAEQAARLAGIFHVVEHGPTGEIGAATMGSAILLASWHLMEAKRVFGLIEQTEEEKNARVLLSFLQKEKGPVSLRRVNQNLPSRELRRNQRARKEAFGILMANGLARELRMDGSTYWEAMR